jgi:hypothetical protein
MKKFETRDSKFETNSKFKTLNVLNNKEANYSLILLEAVNPKKFSSFEIKDFGDSNLFRISIFKFRI